MGLVQPWQSFLLQCTQLHAGKGAELPGWRQRVQVRIHPSISNGDAVHCKRRTELSQNTTGTNSPKKRLCEKLTLTYSGQRLWLPHTLSGVCLRREPVVQTRTTKKTHSNRVSYTLPPSHSGDTGTCYITSSLAYLSSGGWSNCYSEAFRIRRKRLNDNFILTPRKSSVPLVLKHLLSTHRLLWKPKW